ncbi:MAG: hypothetical protein U9R75_09500, partial [Candidatus Thermoplasmatota archaeon]|nr:hypothetical protein [Candidatus Thermoplasmatota archaeon]
LKRSYFVKDIRLYLERIRSLQPMKLTAKGNLTRKFCRDLISNDICTEGGKHFDEYPIIKEDDSSYLLILDNFTKFTGLTKKRGNRLSLTRKGEKMYKASFREFYLFIFENYCRRLNWGCLDGYPDADIIQRSFLYSIFLLQKYGNEKRETSFYLEKFIRAFPKAIDEFNKHPLYVERMLQNCYFSRVFERFMKRFGLVEIIGTDDGKFLFERDDLILKKELIDELVHWDRK